MNAVPIIIPVRDASIGFGLLPRWLFRWVRGPLWRLGGEYVFSLRTSCGREVRTFCIPEGYEFDKASIPPVFWGPPFNYLPDGLCLLPALEHDFLCDLLAGGMRECPLAAEVHEHFRLRLHECGVRRGKAEAMGRAVAALGPQGWGWRWMKGCLLLGLTIYCLL